MKKRDKNNQNNDDYKQGSTIAEEAINQGTTPERLQKKRQGSVKQTPVNQERLQDGYRVTEGQEYENEQAPQEQQEGYHPSHSGVRESLKRPGAPAASPGREGKTGWAESEQMGQTDVPQKNPAN